MTYPLVKFGDVVRQIKDKVDPQTAGLERYVAGEHMDTDNLHIRRWGEVGDGYLGPAFHMRFKPGQILYGSRRTYLRKVAVADFEGITANTTYVIEPKDPEVLLPDFLPFVMSTERFHEHSIKQSKGSVNPYINFSDITWYEFPLLPVDEQRRIADLLWAADDAQENLGNLIASSQNLYSALSKSTLFPRYKVDSSHQIENYIPNDWAIEELEELTVEDAPICYGIVQPGISVESGIPTLAIKDMKGNFVDGVHRTSPDIEKAFSRSRIRGNDVLVSVKATIGEIVIVPEWFTGNVSRDLARIRLKDKVFPHYFLHLWRSPIFQQDVLKLIIGSTRAELRIGDLRKIKIPLPSTKVQMEIVEKLGAVDKAIIEQENHVAQTKSLKFALLNKMINTR